MDTDDALIDAAIEGHGLWPFDKDAGLMILTHLRRLVGDKVNEDGFCEAWSNILTAADRYRMQRSIVEREQLIPRMRIRERLRRISRNPIDGMRLVQRLDRQDQHDVRGSGIRDPLIDAIEFGASLAGIGGPAGRLTQEEVGKAASHALSSDLLNNTGGRPTGSIEQDFVTAIAQACSDLCVKIGVSRNLPGEPCGPFLDFVRSSLEAVNAQRSDEGIMWMIRKLPGDD